MITQRINPDDEFKDPNINYGILMNKLSTRILNLEEDLDNIKDPIVKGFAYKELLKLRETYFGQLKVDLELQHLVLSNPDIYERGE